MRGKIQMPSNSHTVREYEGIREDNVDVFEEEAEEALSWMKEMQFGGANHDRRGFGIGGVSEER
jgi:hypothetical protein